MSRGARLRADLTAVLPAWVTARVLVAAAYVLARAAADRLEPTTSLVHLDEHLLAWDGTWYRSIAELGYDGVPLEGVRFFPLLPLLGRGLGLVTGGHTGLGLVLVANGAALVLAVLVRRVVLLERDDHALADRAVWMTCCFPSAFVLVWGYSEALMLVGVVGVFLCLRQERWWWAAALGALAAASRPLGVLVVAPVLVEVLSGWWAERGAARPRPRGDTLGRGAAVLGPLVGAGAFVVWDGARSGAWLRPFRIQEEFRGDGTDPLTRILEGAGDLVGTERFGDGLHLPFALAFVVLTVVVFRRWPTSYGVYTVLVLVAALSAENLNSLERYGLNAFPLALALADLGRVPWVERLLLAVSAGGLVALTALAWLGAYVP